MTNEFVRKIKNGCKLSCRFDLFGNVNQFIVSTDESQTCIPKGNNNFDEIELYLLSSEISPEYVIDWVAEVKDKDGNLLHYKTNLGLFVDSADSSIVGEIKDKISNGKIEIKVGEEGFRARKLEVSIFLPKSYKLAASRSSSVDCYELDGGGIGLPFDVKIKLLQCIEPGFFEGSDFVENYLRNTKGVVLRFLIDAKNVKKIFNWSKNYLDHELEMLNQSLDDDYALYKRSKSRGPRTEWYFDWMNVQQYVWILTLYIANKVVGLINQQAHRKTTGLISKDDVGDVACIRAFGDNGLVPVWPISNIRDSQISIFPDDLSWSYKPIDMAFKRILFLFDQGLYFESLVVAQAVLESIVNGMFDSAVVERVFGRKELKWEQKYESLGRYFRGDLKDGSWLKSLFDGGFRDIYSYRNRFSHDFLIHRPDYLFDIEVYRAIKSLIAPFVDSIGGDGFLQEVSAMYRKRDEFLLHLSR